MCRTGTHLFHFADYVDTQRGWGRALRRAVATWFNDRPARELAYRALKYQARDGWSTRDLLRLAHPVPPSEQHKAVYWWATKGWEWVGDEPHPDPALVQLWAFERVKRAASPQEVARLVREYRLPREAVPGEWLAHAAVWEALLEEMPVTALIRSLATLTRLGLLAPNADWTARVLAQLGDAERLRRARLHPVTLLSALSTYAQGRGERGQHTWQPVPQIVDALDAAFYASFGAVPSTGARWVLGLDVSSSMDGGRIAGVSGLTPRVAATAMALVTAAVEPRHAVMAVTTAPSRFEISPRERLDDVVARARSLGFGGTDCALPMLWAAREKVAADVFVVYTDSETWAGAIHPTEALRRYRDAMGISAKLIVVGMVSNGFTIADPNDAGMLDVVGFDTATPDLIAGFATGFATAAAEAAADTPAA